MKIRETLKEWKECYKKEFYRSFTLEEPMNYLMIRPLAFMVLKLTEKFSLRPNHFYGIGAILTLVSFFSLSFLPPFFSLKMTSLSIFLFLIVTFAAKMLEGWKKEFHPLSEVIERSVRNLFCTFLYFGLFISYSRHLGGESQAKWFLVSFFLLGISSKFYHKVQKIFLKSKEENENEIDNETLEFFARQERTSFEKTLESFLAHFFLFLKKLKSSALISFFELLLFKLFKEKNEKAKKHEIITSFQMKFAGVIAGSSHLSLLALCLWSNLPGLYYWGYCLFVCPLTLGALYFALKESQEI